MPRVNVPRVNVRPAPTADTNVRRARQSMLRKANVKKKKEKGKGKEEEERIKIAPLF